MDQLMVTKGKEQFHIYMEYHQYYRQIFVQVSG